MVETEITITRHTVAALLDTNPNLMIALGAAKVVRSFGAEYYEPVASVTFRCFFNTPAEAVAAKLRWDGE